MVFGLSGESPPICGARLTPPVKSYPSLPFRGFFFILFFIRFFFDFGPLLQAILIQKSMLSCNVSYHFFGLHFGSFFGSFFVDFQLLETLKIVLPSRRNANFCKIDVFAFQSKICPKSIKIWSLKTTEHRQKSIKKHA